MFKYYPGIFVFFLLLCFEAPAQSYSHNIIELGPEYGLNGQIKGNFHYDQFGFLWMSSPYGLDRYDGKEILNVKTIRQHNTSIESIYMKIFESKDSLIWFFTGQLVKINDSIRYENFHDITWLNPISGKEVSLESKFPDGLPFELQDIASHSKNGWDLYFYTRQKEMYHYDTSFHKIEISAALDLKPLNWYINKAGNIVVLEKNELNIYNFSGSKLNSVIIPSTATSRIFEDKKGQYHVMSLNFTEGHTGYIYSPDLTLIDSLPISKFGVPFIASRKDGLSLKSTAEGLSLIDENNNQIVNINQYLSDHNSFSIKEQIEFPYQHPNVNFTVLQTGISPIIFYSHKSPFENFLGDSEKSNSTRGIATSSQGDILVNTGHSGYFIDSKSGASTFLPPNFKENDPLTASLTNYFDHSSDKFYMVHVHHLTLLNPKDLTMDRIEYHEEMSSLNAFYAIDRLNINEQLVVNSKSGMFWLDEDCQCIKKLIVGNKNHPINQSNITAIHEFEEEVYLITPKEIYSWNPLNQNISLAFSFPKTLEFIPIHNYYCSDKFNLWLATSGSGVIHWDLKTDSLNFINTDQGLSSNITYAILPDNDGSLWISTARGLNSYLLENQTIKSYFPNDGIPHYEFNRLSFHKDQNGQLYFGGLNGITKFDPKNISLLEKQNPETYFSDIIVSDAKGKIRTYNEKENVYLSSKEALRVTYSSPNVRNNEPIKYQYRFNEDPWQVHNSSALNFSNLGLGKHQLQIRGPGIHKEWSDKVAILNIEVPTPFLQSRWFYLVLVGLITLGGYSYARWRIFNLVKTKRILAEEVKKRTLRISKSKSVIEKQASELRRLDSLKSRFFTNISHELRTPLTLIMNPLLELKKEFVETEVQKTFVEMALSGSSQLKKMIDKILKLSEFDSKKILLNEHPIKLMKIAEEMIHPYKSSALSLGIQLNIRTEDTTTGHLMIDVEKLNEVIENLIKNAIKYSGSGKFINIDLKYQQGQLIFICEDEGIGISEEEKEKIFTRYYQSSDGNTPAQGGLGIGLPLAKEFTALMNGTLSVKSELGKGSIFTLKVPARLQRIAKTNEQDTVLLSHSTDQLPSTSHIHDKNLPVLLIIEDHSMMNVLLGNILKSEFNIISATNGQQGLSILKEGKHQIDLVITDWMMPIMDGPEFLTHLRKNPKFQQTPAIMLTARVTQSDRLKVLKIGVDDYIIKPFDPDELKVRIRNLLQNSSIRKKESKSIIQNPEFQKELPANEKWLKTLEEKTLESLGQAHYSVSDLARAMNLGERQLSRKLKSLTGLTPGNYIKEFRLLKARYMLENGHKQTVAEVSYAVGFTTPDYFSKIYINRFGKLPSSYIK